MALLNTLDTQTELFDLFGELGTCAVCQEDLKDGERIRTIRACQHLFHAACLDPWLLQKGDCPICRTKLTLTPAHVAQIQMNDVRSAQENIRNFVNTFRQSRYYDMNELDRFEEALVELENLITQAPAVAATTPEPVNNEQVVLTYCLVEGLLRRYPTAATYNPARLGVQSFLEEFQLDGLRSTRVEFVSHTALKEAKQQLARAVIQGTHPQFTEQMQRNAARNVRNSHVVRTMRGRLLATQQAAGVNTPIRQHIQF